MLKDEEVNHLRSLGDPVADKLLEFYDAVMNDPVEEFYASLRLTIKKISKDLMTIRGNEDGHFNELELNVINRDDKMFERIIMLFKEADKIGSAIVRTDKNADKSSTKQPVVASPTEKEVPLW